MSRVKILMVDDSPEFLEAATRFIEIDPTVQVVGCVMRGQEVLEAIRELQPDVVLMDLAIPDLHGLDVCRLIRKQFDHKPYIIVLTFYDNPEYRASAEALGVVGFIHKSDFGTELLQTIHKVMAHGSLNIEGDVPPESVHEVSQ